MWEYLSVWAPAEVQYWPEEQVVYDKWRSPRLEVIHTEDYRPRLIALRVRPGGWAGLGWEEGALHVTQVPEAKIAEIKACVLQALLMSRDEGKKGEVIFYQRQNQILSAFLITDVYTSTLSFIMSSSSAKCTQGQGCLEEGASAASIFCLETSLHLGCWASNL